MNILRGDLISALRRCLTLAPWLAIAASAALAQDDNNPAAGLAGCAACGGGFIFLFVAIIAINVAILVWVARDAKARGMDSAILWMLLVFFTGVIGLIIYILVRPQGNMIQCPNCHNKKLQAAARCPHCGV
jgi:Phospholipase_D-nuclease N-terminal